MPSGVKWWVVDTVQSFLLPPYGHIITQALIKVKHYFQNIRNITVLTHIEYSAPIISMYLCTTSCTSDGKSSIGVLVATILFATSL